MTLTLKVDPYELRDFISWMLRDHAAAQQIGQFGRELAITLFGWEGRKAEWQKFLESFQ